MPATLAEVGLVPGTAGGRKRRRGLAEVGDIGGILKGQFLNRGRVVVGRHVGAGDESVSRGEMGG